MDINKSQIQINSNKPTNGSIGIGLDNQKNRALLRKVISLGQKISDFRANTQSKYLDKTLKTTHAAHVFVVLGETETGQLETAEALGEGLVKGEAQLSPGEQNRVAGSYSHVKFLTPKDPNVRKLVAQFGRAGITPKQGLKKAGYHKKQAMMAPFLGKPIEQNKETKKMEKMADSLYRSLQDLKNNHQITKRNGKSPKYMICSEFAARVLKCAIIEAEAEKQGLNSSLEGNAQKVKTLIMSYIKTCPLFSVDNKGTMPHTLMAKLMDTSYL